MNNDREREELQAQIKEINQRLEDLGESASDYAQEKWHDARENFSKTGKQVHEYVKENPWQATGIALLAGFLIGMALKKED